jgi:hypothetical protein
MDAPASAQGEGIVAQCVDEKTGALNITGANREFCECLRLQRIDYPDDPQKLRFEATAADPGACKGKGSSASSPSVALDPADPADEPAGTPSGGAGGGSAIGSGPASSPVVNETETRPG